MIGLRGSTRSSISTRPSASTRVMRVSSKPCGEIGSGRREVHQQLKYRKNGQVVRSEWNDNNYGTESSIAPRNELWASDKTRPIYPQITFTRLSSGHPFMRAPLYKGTPLPPNHTCAVMHISQSIATKRSSRLHPPLELPCWPRKDPSFPLPPPALATDATGAASVLAADVPGASSTGPRSSLASIRRRFCGGCSSASRLSSPWLSTPFFSPEPERPCCSLSSELQLGTSPSTGSAGGGGGGGGAPL